MIVGVVADPGFSTRLAQILTDRLPELLRATPLDASAEVDVENVALTLPPATDGSPALDEWFDVLQHKFDLVLVVSEMPRRQASRAVVAEVFRDRMCVFYTPSFGVLGTSRRLLRTVADLLPHLLGTGASGPAPAGTRWVADADGGGRLVSTSPLGRVRLVAGMVRGNRPWRLIPALSGAFGAASAASAFGVFYASIWQMAASMSVTRLTLAVLVAVSTWLIVPNGLWERPNFRSTRADRVLYNSATLGTVVAGAVCMYGLLLLAVMLAAVVVVPDDYLAEQLGAPATLATYVKLAWLAASLGIAAGAVGSTTSDRTEILRATYGRREVERRQAADREKDAET
ncbi:hypothetical protein [Prescottella equi]|uniref:hypothetical protein n=1 Tax=Rhodococcus hoagii TaxID=43767 RepID=UPI000A10949B|nr:hypothetical protein [Prescottella equi]ORL74820.1 hypothetical protein A5905_19610 [Prescottella equi]